MDAAKRHDPARDVMLVGLNDSEKIEFFDDTISSIYLFPAGQEDLKQPATQKALLNLITVLSDSTQVAIDGKSLVRGRHQLVFIVPESFEIPELIRDISGAVKVSLPQEEELQSLVCGNFENHFKMVSTSKAEWTSDEFIKQVEESLSEVIRSIASTFKGLSFNQAVEIYSQLILTLKKGEDSDGTPYLFTDKAQIFNFLNKRKIHLINQSPALEYLPEVSLSEVGGMNQLKQFIEMIKIARTPEAQSAGVKRPKGIFVAGIPGTGKSLVGKAIASELGMGLAKFNLGNLFGGLVGSTEANTRQALEIIEALSPIVVLVDEIDKSINMNQSGGDSGVGSRLLGSLLSFMQETEKDVIFVLTANRVQGLPPELLRKGRIDEVFGIEFPALTERKDIIRIHLKKRGQVAETLDSDLVDTLAERTKQYIAAEIEQLVSDAVLRKFIEKAEKLTLEHFVEPLKLMEGKKLADKAATQHDIEHILTWIREDARRAHIEPPGESKTVSKRFLGTIEKVEKTSLKPKSAIPEIELD
jgi:ATP-dependent 26S proteasome regulatory subunit